MAMIKQVKHMGWFLWSYAPTLMRLEDDIWWQYSYVVLPQ